MNSNYRVEVNSIRFRSFSFIIWQSKVQQGHMTRAHGWVQQCRLINAINMVHDSIFSVIYLLATCKFAYACMLCNLSSLCHTQKRDICWIRSFSQWRSTYMVPSFGLIHAWMNASMVFTFFYTDCCVLVEFLLVVSIVHFYLPLLLNSF